jgi:tRNA(Arg) A34 adenosine deaminase TadA
MSSPRQPNLELLDYAITLADENVRSGKGGPFAAVVSLDGKVVAEGVNLVTSTNDPTAHAEVVAIRRACAALGTFQLAGAEIYSSCEPCPMCLGAIYWARPVIVFYAATSKEAAAVGFDDALIYRQIAMPGPERIIPMVHVPTPRSSVSFQSWQLQQQRVDY